MVSLALISLLGFSYISANTEEDNECMHEEVANVNLISPTFKKLLHREIQTRAYAKLAVDVIHESKQGKPDFIFWSAYRKFEGMNQLKYKHFACKYGEPMAPSFFTRIKEFSGRIPFKLLPGISLRVMRDSTVRYVEVLKKLKAETPPEDLEFAQYIVAQESVQILALTHAMDKNWDLAAGVLDDFIAGQL